MHVSQGLSWPLNTYNMVFFLRPIPSFHCFVHPLSCCQSIVTFLQVKDEVTTIHPEKYLFNRWDLAAKNSVKKRPGVNFEGYKDNYDNLSTKTTLPPIKELEKILDPNY